jgi:UTP-glucose-1-phosphate uridylyltransferase
MAALTNGGPKELLPVGGFTVLHRIINEALDVGATRVRVVGSPLKPQIESFIGDFGDPRVEYATQNEPLGVADAVRAGAEPGQPALVLMGDTIYAFDSPTVELKRRLIDGAWAAVAVHEVPPEEVVHYGVVGFAENGTVDRIIEKPEPLSAPSRFAVASRFALSAEASSALFELMGRRVVDGLTLTDVIDEGINAGMRVDAVFLSDQVQMFDCGQPSGYRAAVEALG